MDETNGLIVLNDFFQYPYCFLECLVSPKEGSEYRIPVDFEEALIAFMGWQDTFYKGATSHFSGNDKDRLKHNFYNELRLAKANYKPLYLEIAYEWSLKNQRMTVKA
jgi:hypothetical protein